MKKRLLSLILVLSLVISVLLITNASAGESLEVAKTLTSDFTNQSWGNWGTWTGGGTTQVPVKMEFVAGEAEDGIGKALVVTGGNSGASAYAGGQFMMPQNFDLTGVNAVQFRYKSTAKINVCFSRHYLISAGGALAASEVDIVKDLLGSNYNANFDENGNNISGKSWTKQTNSKKVYLPSTDGSWATVEIPIEEFGDYEFLSHMRTNIVGTSFTPTYQLRLEGCSFGDLATTGKYFKLDSLTGVWYEDDVDVSIPEKDFALEIGDVTAEEGATTVDVPVKVTKMFADKNIGCLAVNVIYDAEKFFWTEATGYTAGTMIPNPLADIIVSEPDGAGSIFVSFTTDDKTITPEAVAADNTFITLTFGIKDTTKAFTSDITMTAASKLNDGEGNVIISKSELNNYLVGGTVTIEETVVTLESIKISPAKNEYIVGDEFVAPKVTAVYSDGSTEEVEAVFTGYDLSVAGTQTVTVTFEDKTVTYEIIVKATDEYDEDDEEDKVIIKNKHHKPFDKHDKHLVEIKLSHGKHGKKKVMHGKTEFYYNCQRNIYVAIIDALFGDGDELTGATVTNGTPKSFIYGNIDGNCDYEDIEEAVDSADLQAYKRFIKGKKVLEGADLIAADLDGDSLCDSGDLQSLKQFIKCGKKFDILIK